MNQQILLGSNGAKIGAGTRSLGVITGSLSLILESRLEMGTGLAARSSILSWHSYQNFGHVAEPAIKKSRGLSKKNIYITDFTQILDRDSPLSSLAQVLGRQCP